MTLGLGDFTVAAPDYGLSPSWPPGEGCTECSFGMSGKREGPKFLSSLHEGGLECVTF